ncbi:hypothetical protein Rs2_39797 [Raphanus sativus]|nr:hypothetical protein Rs2_39797 [Raphanus sativus]
MKSILQATFNDALTPSLIRKTLEEVIKIPIVARGTICASDGYVWLRVYRPRFAYEDILGPKLTYASAGQELLDRLFRTLKGIHPEVANVASADEFEYRDPVDGSVPKHRGIRYLFEDESRLVDVALKI